MEDKKKTIDLATIEVVTLSLSGADVYNIFQFMDIATRANGFKDNVAVLAVALRKNIQDQVIKQNDIHNEKPEKLDKSK